MPLGFERLNERTQRPNALINFIKPLSGQDNATSLDFLNRIAAQCYPVMKANHISVMALEEYATNPEFLGRNFNAGEVIQLVLKDKSGCWLGFKFVQMVMMHELAHCKQMNHSKAFWQVRNGYSGEMEVLWAKKYLGEGMWGIGRDLASGILMERAPEQGDVPEHLCGGTYRRRGRKRKRGSQGSTAGEGKLKVSYAERQQRRIAKKFGAHGEGSALGNDEDARGALWGNRWQSAKPRVANSKRGRELRAQAALARFGAAKAEPIEKDVKKQRTLEEELGIKQEPQDSGSETEWDDDDGVLEVGENDMVKVCGDEGNDEDDAQNEMDELRNMSKRDRSVSQNKTGETKAAPSGPASKKDAAAARSPSMTTYVDSDTESELYESNAGIKAPAKTSKPQQANAKRNAGAGATRAAVGPKAQQSTTMAHVNPETESESHEHDAKSKAPTISPRSGQQNQPQQPSPPESSVTGLPQGESSASTDSHDCPICSLENPPGSTTCVACAHVLRPGLMPNHWRCTSETCKGSVYLNAGDCGVCGICAAPKPKANPRSGAGFNGSSGMRPVGLTGSDVLRWD